MAIFLILSATLQPSHHARNTFTHLIKFAIVMQENLKMAVQRLKDETRDLRSELKVLNPQVVRKMGVLFIPDDSIYLFAV